MEMMQCVIFVALVLQTVNQNHDTSMNIDDQHFFIKQQDKLCE
jgi:hypothetical protein